MPAGATYEPIATTTLTTSQSTVTFSSISSSYTDLILVVSGTGFTNMSLSMRFNNDSGNNYSGTFMYGLNTSAVSGRTANRTEMQAIGRLGSSDIGQARIHIFNYSNTSTFKTILGRGGIPSEAEISTCQMWRSTSAVNRIDLAPEAWSGTFNSGCTFTLYGIAAA